MGTGGVSDYQEKNFLPTLISAFESIDVRGTDSDEVRIETAAFASACEPILDAFHLLGSVLAWAKTDFEQKRRSIAAAADKYPSLHAIVEADKEAGTLEVKNSNARNLHRLKCGVHFIVVLLERLCASTEVTMREAAAEAYAAALKPIHNWAVQAAVQASLLTCPTREFFLKEIRETDETAAALARKFAQVADPVVVAVNDLYKDGAPPPSGTWGSSWSW
uniref:Glycolipid transfer protein n=1 Tax=Tetraselmis sp. GSL018 TaxID=582737 RepID=A0A061RP19_9CHLO|mmetsp:Transcript_8333/g.19978  ORF Transcript_8333/g.19978 Transcript_8333/m.19978 type:complete len:220 (+) Transcript_8333:81-740(+)